MDMVEIREVPLEKFMFEVDLEPGAAAEFVQWMQALGVTVQPVVGLEAAGVRVASEAMSRALEIAERAEGSNLTAVAEAAKAWVNTAYSALRLSGAKS